MTTSQSQRCSIRWETWTRDEARPPYPLAEACHDHAIGLAIVEAAASDVTVTVGEQPWHDPAPKART